MLFDIREITPENFEAHALRLFQYQYENVDVYRRFVSLIGTDVSRVQSLSQIPFLPISFFKSHQVIANGATAQTVFESSTTTGLVPSRHFVADLDLYRKSCVNGFEKAYGNPADWSFLALLPSYLQRGNSSLVWMVNELMKLSRAKSNGFFLDDLHALSEAVLQNETNKQKTMVIGVSYALLDWADKWKGKPLAHTTIMETGGMKGRRKEMLKSDLHCTLQHAFGVSTLHSEYGMTELLSQAYSVRNGIYQTPWWMRVSTRDINDPLASVPVGQSGALNIIDLANQYSCAFIATDDLGRVNENDSFEVLGRLDNSELRGCNLMVG